MAIYSPLVLYLCKNSLLKMFLTDTINMWLFYMIQKNDV